MGKYLGLPDSKAPQWWNRPPARIAAGLLGVLLLLVLMAGCGGVPDDVAEEAESGAEYYCSMAVGNAGIYSAEFTNCVEAETQSRVEEWEAAH